MRPSSKSAAAAAAPASLTSPKSGTTKRLRKAAAAAAAPLSDVTNLLVAAASPTPTPTPSPSPSKPRRTARRSLPARSDVSAVSSACSSSASVTPAPKPPSAAASARLVPKPSAAAALAAPARKPSSAASATPVRASSSACVTPALKPSSSARVVTPAPVPRPSSAAVLEEERGVLKSPAIATVYRRTTEAQGRWRRNPAAANSKGKEPVAATASCSLPHGKSARTLSRKNDIRPISASAPCYEGKKKRSITSTPDLLEDLLEKQRAYFADIDAFQLVEEVVSESEQE